MRTVSGFFGAMALVVLAGCDAPDDVAVEVVDFDEPAVLTEEAANAGLPEECDAAEYRGFIGQNIAAVTVPTGPMLRAYGETDIITQDYLPQRTNIVYNAEGTILRVTCG